MSERLMTKSTNKNPASMRDRWFRDLRFRQHIEMVKYHSLPVQVTSLNSSWMRVIFFHEWVSYIRLDSCRGDCTNHQCESKSSRQRTLGGLDGISAATPTASSRNLSLHGTPRFEFIIPWHSTSLFAYFYIDVPSRSLYSINAIFNAAAETLPVTAEKTNP